MSKPRAAIYARQSIKKDDGITLQLEHCRKEANERDWEIVAKYEDNHISGSRERDETSGWGAMLDAYDKGKFDTLIVNEVSRLTRRIVDVLEVRPPKRDIRIIVRRGGIDTDDPMGDFIFKLFVLIAEQEVELKKARAKVFAAQNREQGHPTAGRVAYGYTWVPKTHRDEKQTRWAINEDEAEIVQQIFKGFFAQLSMKEIARRLNAEGHRTRSGHMWGASTIRRILLNPVYAGLLAPAQPDGQFRMENIVLEECQPGAWEKIVTYDEIVATRGKILNTKPLHDGTARKWLLPGIAICGGCGGPIRSAVAKNRPRAVKGKKAKPPKETYHAYRCATVGKGCFQRAGDIIDEYIKEACILRLSQDDAADLFVPDDGLDIGVLHARRQELEARSEFIYEDAARRGRFDAARKSLDDLDEELRVVNDQIAEVLNREPLAELAAVDDIRAWWENASLTQQRTLVQMLMVPTIHPVGPGRRVHDLERVMETVSIEWRGRDNVDS